MNRLVAALGYAGEGGGSFAPLPPNASPGKKWRFRRNVVIYVAWKAGVSQRVLADVFDLPRSRIATIINEVRGYEPENP